MVTSVKFLHTEAVGQPIKKSKKGGARGSVALLKETIQLGCVSRGKMESWDRITQSSSPRPRCVA